MSFAVTIPPSEGVTKCSVHDGVFLYVCEDLIFYQLIPDTHRMFHLIILLPNHLYYHCIVNLNMISIMWYSGSVWVIKKLQMQIHEYLENSAR